MPQYQQIDAPPNYVAEAAGRFGAGLSDSLKRAREQQQKVELIDQILGESKQAQQPMQTGPASYLGQGPGAPDNIGQLFANMEQNPDHLARQGIVSGNAPSRMNKLTPEKFAAINAIDPSLGKALQPAYESQQGKEKEGVKADVKRSTEFLTKVDKIEEALPRKELALRQIEDAVAKRDNLNFLGDVFADLTGREIFRSAKGAQLLSSTKEFFLSDLGSIPGLRPNQFLERALSSALTDTSRKQEANEMVLAGLKSNVQLDKAKALLTRQLEDHYRNTLGYIPASIANDVNKALLPVAQELQNRWANDIYRIEQKHDSKIQKFEKAIDNPAQRKRIAKDIKLKKVGEGIVLDETMGLILLEKYNDDEQKALDAARKLGYTIPGVQ